MALGSLLVILGEYDVPVPMLVFSDLDGTLLDHDNYSYEPVVPILDHLKDLGIPVIFNTSKTRAETQILCDELCMNDPFIVENGAAVVMPPQSGYPQRISGLNDRHEFVLAEPRSHILRKLNTLRRQGFRFESYQDWTVERLAQITNLKPEEARRSHARAFTEPVIWRDSDQQLELFKRLLNAQGLTVLKGGRFLHIMSGGGKGEAMKWMVAQWQSIHHARPIVLALGDGGNDVSMLNEADYAVVIKSPVNPYPEVTTAGEVIQTGAPGPHGWARAVRLILQTHGWPMPRRDRLIN